MSLFFSRELVLNPGENLIMEGFANKWQTLGNKGGKLYLTNQRLVFIAHRFNFGSKYDELMLSDIATQGNTFKFKTTFHLISFTISIETKTGEKVSFVISPKQKQLWVEKIGQSVMEYVSQNPQAIQRNSTTEPTIATQTTPIKVVRCEGCGAAVVIMAVLAKCDYCKTPTVG